MFNLKGYGLSHKFQAQTENNKCQPPKNETVAFILKLFILTGTCPTFQNGRGPQLDMYIWNLAC